jgi:hypothetical protein
MLREGGVRGASALRLREGAMHKIVEAVVRSGDRRVPVGLMNIKQALEMSDKTIFEFSHPEHEAGKTDIFISREVLQTLS